MHSSGPLHMDKQKQDDQLEPTYSTSVPIQDVALKTCWEQWMIEKGGERGSGISTLMAQHDDDDDVICRGASKKGKISCHEIYILIYLSTFLLNTLGISFLKFVLTL